MTLEGLGIPTLNLVTDAFEQLFKLEAEQQGIAALPYVVIPHPLGGLRPEAVVARADACAAAVRAGLLAQPRGAAA